MVINFNKEVDLITSNNQISEKLMIFALYNEFYNSILSSTDDYFIKCYTPFMDKTFELAAAGIDLQEKSNVNAEQFMRIYFEMLKINSLSSIPNEIITSFEKELKSLIASSKYVNIIEQFATISLGVKVNIMISFREYINNMFITTINLFGEESSKELRDDILDMQLIRLEKYLNDSLNEGINQDNLTDDLKSVMMVATKDYLLNKLSNHEFGFDGIKDEATRDFFASFSEAEQKIWLIGAIYGIAGYDKNDRSKDNEKIEEICKYLGISKIEYIVLTISIGIRSFKTMKKAMDEIESETFDDDCPKKRKQ